MRGRPLWRRYLRARNNIIVAIHPWCASEALLCRGAPACGKRQNVLTAANCSRAASCKIPPRFAVSRREPSAKCRWLRLLARSPLGLTFALAHLTTRKQRICAVCRNALFAFLRKETLLETSIILESARISKGHLSGEVREILTALKAPLFKVEPDISTNNGHPLLGLGEMSERISTRANGARAATSLP